MNLKLNIAIDDVNPTKSYRLLDKLTISFLKMKLLNSNIEDLIREILIKQETEINKYIENYMTVEEATRHADNIYNLIARAEPTIAFLKMKLLNSNIEI